MTTHSGIAAWEIPWKRSLAGCSLWSLRAVGHDLVSEQQQCTTVQQIFCLCFCFYTGGQIEAQIDEITAQRSFYSI